MKKQLMWRRGATVLATAATLVAGAAITSPAASVARSASTCANKSIKITNEGRTLSIPVKAITVEGGVSCATAYKVIAGSLVGKPVAGWSVHTATFKAPEGLVPELAKKGSKKIKFAVQGG
jgi:hypothetical protein